MSADLRAAWGDVLAGWTFTHEGKFGESVYRHPGQTAGMAADIRDDGRGGHVLRMHVDYLDLKAGYGYTKDQARQLLQPTPAEAVDNHFAEIEHEANRMRVRDAARRLIASESAEAIDLPAPTSLDAFLDELDEDPEYRIDRLLPTGGNVLFPAPAKSGKSTTTGNACRSFADGDPFLGTFHTKPARVVLIDNELDPRGLRRWLRDQGIRNPQNVDVVALRGRTRTFDIIDDATRARWADLLRGADVLIFDCLRPVLDALGLDENRDAGQFLVALDALKTEAGISEAILVHHMGHNAERARGDSRLLGWPDVTWKITLEKPDDPLSPRFFSAFGRDVNVPESQLEYDPITRHLTVTALSRRDAAIDVAIEAIVELLTEHPNGLSQKAIEDTLNGNGIPRSDIREGLHRAQQHGHTIVTPGPRGAKLHVLLPQLASSPHLAASSPASTPSTSPPPI